MTTSYKKRGIRSILAPENRRIDNLTLASRSRIQPLVIAGVGGGSKLKYLYKTTRWVKLRAEVLKRDMYTCQLCGAVGDAAGKLVCDHVRGHPPDETEEMFWRGPFQTVCEQCHNTVRAKEDNSMKKRWYAK